jgi:hypothetical protein
MDGWWQWDWLKIVCNICPSNLGANKVLNFEPLPQQFSFVVGVASPPTLSMHSAYDSAKILFTSKF